MKQSCLSEEDVKSSSKLFDFISGLRESLATDGRNGLIAKHDQIRLIQESETQF